MTVYSRSCLSAKATASSSVSKRSWTSFRVSCALAHPINGSGRRGVSGSYSRIHLRVCARPDCIAVLAGLYMRARAIDRSFRQNYALRCCRPGGGRGERIRTSDILLPKQALYQAEPRPATRIAAGSSRFEGVAQPRRGSVVCPACSIAWGWKSPVQPDGGEGLAKHKGVIARWRLKAVWSKTAT